MSHTSFHCTRRGRNSAAFPNSRSVSAPCVPLSTLGKVRARANHPQWCRRPSPPSPSSVTDTRVKEQIASFIGPRSWRSPLARNLPHVCQSALRTLRESAGSSPTHRHQGSDYGSRDVPTLGTQPLAGKCEVCHHASKPENPLRNRRRLRPTATQGCPGCLSTPARRPRLTTLAQPPGWVSAAIKQRTQKGRGSRWLPQEANP